MGPTQRDAAAPQPVTATVCLLMQAHPPWRYTDPMDKAVESMTEPKDSGDSPTSREVAQNVTRLTWRQTLSSALAAGLGVQSAHNQERDFAAGSTRRFIVTGVVLTALFIGALISVVRFIVA